MAGRRGWFVLLTVAAFLCTAAPVRAAPAPARVASEATVPAHDMAVRIDPATRRIEGHDIIALGARRAAVPPGRRPT